MNKEPTKSDKKISVDWEELVLEWFPMIVAVTIVVLANMYFHFLYYGKPLDLHNLYATLPIIAAIIQFTKAKSAMPLVVTAFVGGCIYMIP